MELAKAKATFLWAFLEVAVNRLISLRLSWFILGEIALIVRRMSIL